MKFLDGVHQYRQDLVRDNTDVKDHGSARHRQTTILDAAVKRYLLPSRSAWTHCLASCVMSSSSVDAMTLAVFREAEGAVIVSPTLSTSGCAGVCRETCMQ